MMVRVVLMLLLRNNSVAWIIWLMIMMVVFGDDVQSDDIDIDSDGTNNKKQPYRLSQVHQLCKLVLVEVAILTAVVHVHLLQFNIIEGTCSAQG